MPTYAQSNRPDLGVRDLSEARANMAANLKEDGGRAGGSRCGGPPEYRGGHDRVPHGDEPRGDLVYMHARYGACQADRTQGFDCAGWLYPCGQNGRSARRLGHYSGWVANGHVDHLGAGCGRCSRKGRGLGQSFGPRHAFHARSHALRSSVVDRLFLRDHRHTETDPPRARKDHPARCETVAASESGRD